MVRIGGALSVGLMLLAGCSQPTRVVEVQVPVEVPGPARYVEIPQDLLRCDGVPEIIVSGITGAQLRTGALDWQRYAQCLEARMNKIAELNQGVTP